jgi:dolichol-phosphate mannosyltransferase
MQVSPPHLGTLRWFSIIEEPKVAFVIPAYNEAQALPKLLGNIKKKILSSQENIDILVFEDGSTDETKEVLKTLQNSGEIPQLKAFMTPDRKGYTLAVKDAIKSLDPKEYPYLLFIDGDGQYYMKDVLKLITLRTADPPYDFVDGCRKKRLDPVWRKILTAGARFVLLILFKPKIKDVTSGLWLMNTEKAQEIISQVKYSYYNIWLEFTSRVAAGHYRVREVPVDHLQRDEEESRVYRPQRMPNILWTEVKAVFLTFLELNLKTIIKFAFAGGTGAIIILFLTWLLTEQAGLWYILSAAISIELSIWWAFALNTKITFQHNFKNSGDALRSVVKYHGTALGGMAINLTVLYLLTQYFQLYYLLSEFIGIVVAFGFNYLASRHYVWVRSAGN